MSFTQSVNSEKLDLFGGDKRGKLFSATYLATPGSPVNASSGYALRFLEEGNYDSASDKKSTNLAPQMVEFLKSVGNLHKKINENSIDPLRTVLKNKLNHPDPTVRRFYLEYVDPRDGGVNTSHFMRDIPEVPSLITGSSPNALREAYKAGLLGTLGRAAEGPDGYFGIDIDRLVARKFVGIKKSATPGQFMAPEVQPKELISLTDHNVWKFDKNGVLYTTLPNGDRVNFGDEDTTTLNAIKRENKCFSTLLDKASADDCNDYVVRCLAEDDANSLSKCGVLHKSGTDFWQHASNEIRTMHPLVALRTLEKYGFNYVTKYDEESGLNLNKIEHVDHWLNNYMATKFSNPKDQDAIRKNTQLLDYLELIVQYVNANPALINKHYSGNSDETVGNSQPTEYAKRLGIQQYRRVPAEHRDVYEMNLLGTHQRTSMLGATVNRPVSYLRAPFGYGASSVGVLLGGSGIQLGGGDVAIAGSRYLDGLIQVAIHRLRRNNISLDDASVEAIKAKLNKMQSVELELQKTVAYLNTFADMQEYSSDYNSKILSDETLRNLVNRYKTLRNKLHSGESDFTTILGALTKLQVGEETDLLSEVEKGYTPVNMSLMRR
jgi:hypothetical protein